MLKSTPAWKKYTTAGFVVATNISYAHNVRFERLSSAMASKISAIVNNHEFRVFPPPVTAELNTTCHEFYF